MGGLGSVGKYQGTYYIIKEIIMKLLAEMSSEEMVNYLEETYGVIPVAVPDEELYALHEEEEDQGFTPGLIKASKLGN